MVEPPNKAFNKGEMKFYTCNDEKQKSKDSRDHQCSDIIKKFIRTNMEATQDDKSSDRLTYL